MWLSFEPVSGELSFGVVEELIAGRATDEDAVLVMSPDTDLAERLRILGAVLAKYVESTRDS